MTLEKYEKTLDMWAAEEKEKAMEAKKAGDERKHSIRLMKASMLGDMLKVLGKYEMQHGRKGLLEKKTAFFEKESERMKERGDFDAAERSMIQAETIRRARRLIYEGDE